MSLLPVQSLFENVLILSCLRTLWLCSLFVIVGLFWTQVVFYRTAEGQQALFRTVVWREVGKISFSPSGPFLCLHSQAAQPGISRAQQELFHLLSALISSVLSLFFLSRTASLLLFLAVSWGFAVSVSIGNYSVPIYRMVILDWEMLNWNDGSWVMGIEKQQGC